MRNLENLHETTIPFQHFPFLPEVSFFSLLQSSHAAPNYINFTSFNFSLLKTTSLCSTQLTLLIQLKANHFSLSHLCLPVTCSWGTSWHSHSWGELSSSWKLHQQPSSSSPSPWPLHLAPVAMVAVGQGLSYWQVTGGKNNSIIMCWVENKCLMNYSISSIEHEKVLLKLKLSRGVLVSYSWSRPHQCKNG